MANKKILLLASMTYQPVINETDKYYEAVDIDKVVTHVSKNFIHNVILEEESVDET
jgi:hypothetical protein